MTLKLNFGLLAQKIKGVKMEIIEYVWVGIGSLLVGYGIYVAMTPGKEDDKKWEKIKSKPIIGAIIALLQSKSIIKKAEEKEKKGEKNN